MHFILMTARGALHEKRIRFSRIFETNQAQLSRHLTRHLFMKRFRKRLRMFRFHWSCFSHQRPFQSQWLFCSKEGAETSANATSLRFRSRDFSIMDHLPGCSSNCSTCMPRIFHYQHMQSRLLSNQSDGAVVFPVLATADNWNFHTAVLLGSARASTFYKTKSSILDLSTSVNTPAADSPTMPTTIKLTDRQTELLRAFFEYDGTVKASRYLTLLFAIDHLLTSLIL